MARLLPLGLRAGQTIPIQKSATKSRTWAGPAQVMRQDGIRRQAQAQPMPPALSCHGNGPESPKKQTRLHRAQLPSIRWMEARAITLNSSVGTVRLKSQLHRQAVRWQVTNNCTC